MAVQASEPRVDEAQARLHGHASYLTNLISLIPPKFYFPVDPEETARKYQKYTGKQPQVPKHQRKLEANERKTARLDPNQLDVPEQLLQMKDGAGQPRRVKAGRGDSDDEEDDEEDDEDDSEDEDMEEGDLPSASDVPKPERVRELPVNREALFAGTATSASVQGIRDKLAERLAQLRGSRGGVAGGKDRHKEDGGKKEKQKKHKPAKPSKEIEGDAGSWPSGEHAANGGAAAGGGSRPSCGIEFSKLAAAARAPKGKRRLSTAELLAQAEEKERQKKARLLSPDGGGEDVQIAEWQKAFEKAGGIKIKDNPKLLRKTLKRKESQKKKSQQQWKQRVKSVAKLQTERQEKRKQNLKDRGTKAKTKASRNRGEKPRAGFEGKKNNFIT